MYVFIIAIGWLYVVLLMALTERNIVAGVLTFVLYGLLPLTAVLYIMGTPARRRRARASELAQQQAQVEATSNQDDPPKHPSHI
jgi:biotin transporter BioY